MLCPTVSGKGREESSAYWEAESDPIIKETEIRWEVISEERPTKSLVKRMIRLSSPYGIHVTRTVEHY